MLASLPSISNNQLLWNPNGPCSPSMLTVHPQCGSTWSSSGMPFPRGPLKISSAHPRCWPNLCPSALHPLHSPFRAHWPATRLILSWPPAHISGRNAVFPLLFLQAISGLPWEKPPLGHPYFPCLALPSPQMSGFLCRVGQAPWACGYVFRTRMMNTVKNPTHGQFCSAQCS